MNKIDIMKKILVIVTVILTTVISAFAQKTDKFSYEITIDCEDIQAAKMTSDETIYGKAKDMDITFPFKTRINPDKGAEIKLKAPGYKEYDLIIPRGAFESYYMVAFTVDAKEMAKLNKENVKVEKSNPKADKTMQITIHCDQVESATMGIGKGFNYKIQDVIFPFTTEIEVGKEHICRFFVPGYNWYQIIIPKGNTETNFRVHFTEDPKAMAKLSAQEAKAVEKGKSSKKYEGSVSVGKVSRDTPGMSAPEQTIIRWMVDSDPQGARIFYRVISSTTEVQNTNEAYLLTTPYEETRAFNILGLTYENARNVQIEIKIMKPGYHPQVKRFNVRQALDQQEISTFFQLVKKEEE